MDRKGSVDEEDDEDEEEDDEEDDESSSEEETDSSSTDEEDGKSPQERMKEKAAARIKVLTCYFLLFNSSCWAILDQSIHLQWATVSSCTSVLRVVRIELFFEAPRACVSVNWFIKYCAKLYNCNIISL